MEVDNLPESFPKNPPQNLPRKGKTLWRRLIPELVKAEAVYNIDRTGLEELCFTYGVMKQLENQIQEAGWSVDDGRGSIKKHPLFTELKFYREQFLKLCKAYQLLPKWRDNSKLAQAKRAEKQKEVKNILNGDFESKEVG